MRITSREKKITGVTLALIFIYGGFNFIFKPIKQKEAILDEEIQAEIKLLNKDFLAVKKEKQLKREYENLLVPFRQQNSDEEEMSVLLSQMQTLATQTGLRIVDIKPQKSRKTEFCKFLPLSLSLEGYYSDVIRFLYVVQATPYSLGVDELFLEFKPSQRNVLTCRIDLSRILIPAN